MFNKIFRIFRQGASKSAKAAVAKGKAKATSTASTTRKAHSNLEQATQSAVMAVGAGGGDIPSDMSGGDPGPDLRVVHGGDASGGSGGPGGPSDPGNPSGSGRGPDDSAPKDEHALNPDNFKITRYNLFWEFEGPGTIKEPDVDDRYAADMARRAIKFFDEQPFDPKSEIEGHAFYEEVEMDFFADSYGKISKMGEPFLDALEKFRQTTTHNDGMVTMRIPLTLAILYMLCSLFFAYCASGSNIPEVLAPLSGLAVNLGAQAGVCVLLLLVYTFLYKLPYKQCQKQSVSHFDRFILSITTFSRTQFLKLKNEYILLQDDKNMDDVKDPARDYSGAICWSIFAAYLLRCSLRAMLFHHRRDLILLRFGAILLLLILGGLIIWATQLLTIESMFYESFPWWNIVLLLVGLIAFVIAQTILTNSAEGHLTGWMNIHNWQIFGSHNFGIQFEMMEMAEADKVKIIQFRDLYKHGGGRGPGPTVP